MESLLINLKSTGVFIIVLSILVIVHEWGHFITAKKLGVRVEKFSLGFGPKLYSTVHDNTEFLICAIPLGGYVKMAGDERDKCTGEPDEFYAKPIGHRSLIVINGPVVNFILAYICLALVFMFGYPDLKAKVGKLMAGYPAAQAGLKEGDEILSINGQPVASWTELQNSIQASPNVLVKIDVRRGDQTLSVSITSRVEQRKNIFGQIKETRLIGITPSKEMTSLKYGLGASLVKAFDKLVEITTMTYKAIYFMLTGAMSAKESMTGPIGIFYIIKSATEMGITHLILIVGVISASLAIFNLLPVIPLDGGHLFLYGIEKLRGKALPPKIDEFIMRLGITAILLLAIFVFYNDFARFGWIDKIKSLF